MYLSGPVLDNLWSLSYLSTKYSKIARVSLSLDQPATSGHDHVQDIPNGEVVVMVVDDGGNATVGVELYVLRALVFCLAEIEVHGFIG